MKRVARVENKYDIKILKKCILGVKTSSVFPLLRNVIMDYYSGLSSFMHVVISLPDARRHLIKPIMLFL